MNMFHVLLTFEVGFFFVCVFLTFSRVFPIIEDNSKNIGCTIWVTTEVVQFYGPRLHIIMQYWKKAKVGPFFSSFQIQLSSLVKFNVAHSTHHAHY